MISMTTQTTTTVMLVMLIIMVVVAGGGDVKSFGQDMVEKTYVSDTSKTMSKTLLATVMMTI